MTSRGSLPHFVVIGAIKAATTWIQAQLQANSAIYMPDPEPHFFSREYERGEEHYRRWFEPAPASATLIGEKSADYLSDPAVPARMAAMLPDARLVIQLRNPVDRAYSHYKMLFRRGTVEASPEKYLSTLDNEHPCLLLDGLYGQHLQRWLDHFPREQFLAFPFEDVTRDARGIVERVSHHIGIGPVFDAGSASQTENDSRTRILPLPVRNLLAPLKQSAKPFRGHPWFEGARSLLAREIAYPPLGEDLRTHLEDFYRDDIGQTERLLGLDLSHWRRGPARRDTVAAA
jgi:hypothetical protein